MYQVMRQLGSCTASGLKKELSAVQKLFNSNVFTTVYDAGGLVLKETEQLKAVSEIEAKNQLTLYYFTSYFYNESKTQSPADLILAMKQLQNKYTSKLVCPTTLKMLHDGTVEVGCAYMFEPYNPPLKGAGFTMTSYYEMLAASKLAATEGFNIHIHAIGDKAIAESLQLYKTLGPIKGTKTIAHAQVFPEGGCEEFIKQGDVFCQVTPVWLGSCPFTLTVLGKTRYLRQMPLGTFYRGGVKLAFGSDLPASGIEGLNPFFNMYCTIMRSCDDGTDLSPQTEGVDIKACIDAYTINGAMQVGAEDEIGSIKVGKSADFIVLDRDILTIPVAEIKDIKVGKTFFQGKCVFDQNVNSLMINCSSFATINAMITAGYPLGTNYVGGITGYLKDAPTVASARLKSTAILQDKLQDIRLRYKGYSSLIASEHMAGTSYASTGIGYASNTYLAGIELDFNHGTLRSKGAISSYVGGVCGYFNSSAIKTAIYGCENFSDNIFNFDAIVLNTGTSLAGGIVGYINVSSGVCELTANDIDADHTNDGESNAVINASDFNGTSNATIYAGGLYGYFNASKEFLHGKIRVEAIQNGRGSAYAGGFCAVGSCTFLPPIMDSKISLVFNDVTVLVTQKTTVKNASSSAYAGAFFANINSTNQIFYNMNITLKNTTVKVVREETAVGGLIYCGGLIGNFSSASGTSSISSCLVTLDNAQILVNQESFDVKETSAYLGGVVGLISNGKINKVKVIGKNNSKVIFHSNTYNHRGSYDTFVGGLAGRLVASMVEDVYLLGEGAKRDQFYILLSIDNVANTSPAGGLAGGANGVYSKATETSSGSFAVTANRCRIENITVKTKCYNQLSGNQYDTLVGGLIGEQHGPSSNPVFIECYVGNSDIIAEGLDNSIAVVGGITATAWGESQLIEKSVVGNCNIIATAQKMAACAGGIVGRNYDTNTTLKSCLSIGNAIQAYSSGSTSAVGGLAGQTFDATTYSYTLYSCFSNSVLIATNLNPNRICRGGFVGRIFGNASTTQPTAPTSTNTSVVSTVDNSPIRATTRLVIDNSYFHLQNAGTEYAAIGNSTIYYTPLTPGYSLDFSDVVLDDLHTYAEVLNPKAWTQKSLTPSLAPNNLKAVGETTGAVSPFSSIMSYSNWEAIDTSAAHEMSFGAPIASVWNIYRKTDISFRSAKESWLNIVPFGTQDSMRDFPYYKKDGSFHFGTLNAVVTFSEGEVVPNPDSVTVCDGSHITNAPILEDTTRFCFYGDAPIALSGYTSLTPEGSPIVNYYDGFHNVVWHFFDSYPDGSRNPTPVFSGLLSKYATFDVENNLLLVKPTVEIDGKVVFYVQAVDYINQSKQ